MHGWQAFDELLRGFARTVAALREKGHLGPRDIVAVMSVRSDKFLVFLRGGDGAPLDADSIEGRARRLRERIVEALPAHLGPGVEQPVTFDLGYALMYRDPMLRAERSIHRALDEAMLLALRQRTRDEDRRPGLGEIIAAGRSTPCTSRSSTCAQGGRPRRPPGDALREAGAVPVAERTGRLLDLELSRARAWVGARLPRISLNTSARARGDRTWPGRGSCGWWMRAGYGTSRSSWRSRSAFPRRRHSPTSRP